MTDEEFTADVERYGNMLFRLVFANTGDLSCCDDIVQEVFIKYLKCGKRFPDEESRRYWLIRVAVNKCRDHTRLYRITHRSEWDGNTGREREEALDERIALREALKKLSPKYREVIFLYYYEGYSAAQTGKILKISTSAVTSRLQRAREALKKYLE